MQRLVEADHAGQVDEVRDELIDRRQPVQQQPAREEPAGRRPRRGPRRLEQARETSPDEVLTRDGQQRPVARLGEEDRQRRARHQRAGEQGQQQVEPQRARRPEQEERVDEVELLLDRQRPEVAGDAGRPAVHEHEDVVQVEEVPPRMREPAGQEQHDEDEVVEREDSQRAAGVEDAEVAEPVARLVQDEQAGDEEARQDEEERDAERRP